MKSLISKCRAIRSFASGFTPCTTAFSNSPRSSIRSFPRKPAKSDSKSKKTVPGAKSHGKKVNDLGWSTTFRIADWDDSKNVKYRLLHGEKASFEGLIRKNPVDKDEIIVAALSCNSNKDRGLRPEYVRNINHHDPDLVFFAGDQSYDHKQHTAAWLKFGLAFRDVFRERPCVTIPDDHDIGQGNLWGEGESSMTCRFEV
jgi:hypothetical protein